MNKKYRILGRSIPAWILLFIAVSTAFGTIVVVLQKTAREEISVEGVGLDFVGIDVSVTTGSVLIEYVTYEESHTTISSAYSMTNNNPAGLDLMISPQTPTGSFDNLDSYSAVIDSIEFMSYDGTTWTMTDFGIFNGESGVVSIDLVVGSGTTLIGLDCVYGLELTDVDEFTGSTYTCSVINPPQASFLGSSPGLNLGFWVGTVDPSATQTFDFILADIGTSNETSISVTNDPVLEYEGSFNCDAEWAAGVVESATMFYFHVQETGQYIAVPPP